MKSIAILGSTGSIGRNALQVAAMFPERLAVKALAARNNIDLLADQIRRFRPEIVSVFDEETASALKRILPAASSTEILFGDEGYRAVASHSSVDTVLSAMVGAAGLLPTVTAIEAGKEIALANKETLVMAGDIVMPLAGRKGVRILPVDSEHSAIFQCLCGQRREDLVRIYLTASGGPFLERPARTFHQIRPRDALRHPTWAMGRKITIDSATLMNKGLEVIEARHLFGIPLADIEVVVHPQSMVHSLVAFRDGSMIAQLGAPDMRTAIAYALTFPERLPLGIPAPELAAVGSLGFQKPDGSKFPCLGLAYAAGETGGTMPAVMNAANEEAVAAFLAEQLDFDKIPRAIEETMSDHRVEGVPDLAAVLAADGWARRTARQRIRNLMNR
ncbi:MAG: 1-deoxy-D-xylulose-5-phosphate reductoisomerase [Thermodesulfobacteriota bacterium]